MKKTIKSLLALAVAAFAFTACSDIPEPEGYNSDQGDGKEVFEPTGDGGQTTPWNVAGILKASVNWNPAGTLPKGVYTKGYIKEFNTQGSAAFNPQYGNLSFYITDSKTGNSDTFYAFHCKGLGNKSFTSASDLKVGDEVIIIGDISTYNGQYQYGSNVYLYSLNGQTEGGGGGGDAIEVTCAEAVTATNNLADNATSTETYAVTGYITTVVGNVSNNQQTFWMADTKDGGKVFEAYWANLPSGVSAFTVGMKVKITGNLIKYVKNGDVTPEIKNATVEILEGGGESGGESGGGQGGSGYGTLSGNVLTLNCTGLDLASNPTSIALVDGTTLTLAKNDGNNNPAYNSSYGELRLYARNSFTINAGSKTIASVKLYCTLHNDNPGVGNDGEVTASSGTLDIQKEAMTIQATSVNNSSFTLTNGYAAKNSGGIQIRFNKMEITYAQ